MKKCNLRPFLVFVLSFSVMFGLFAGCSQDKQDITAGQKTEEVEINKNELTGSRITDKSITLKYWIPLHASAAKIIKDFSENEVYKELEKRTGIQVEFLHPPAGQEKEQYQLMIAANELPDMITHGWSAKYPGGPDKAINDGVYLKLNDLIDKYAPNYKKLRDSNPKIARQTITDSGNIWAFSCIQTSEEPAWSGPIIRKDYLDKVGMEMPETVEDWDRMLRAFKNQLGVKTPLLLNGNDGSLSNSVFASAFGVADASLVDKNFYLDDGKVKYGPIEPGYKEYLTLMAQWYKNDLVDQDFATRDANSKDALVTNGEAGAWVGAYGRDLDRYIMLMEKKNTEFELLPIPYPVLNEGEQVTIRQTNFYNKGRNTAVTSACKYQDEAVKWLDYAYGEEGKMLFNYGFEGVSYEMVNGKPVYTKLMLDNPDGYTFDVLSWKYKVHTGPYLRDVPTPRTDIIKLARKEWSKAGSDGVIPLITLTSEEGKKYSKVMNEVSTYQSEIKTKTIMGIEPVSKYDECINQIKKMGIEEAIKIQQAAVDRYYSR